MSISKKPNMRQRFKSWLVTHWQDIAILAVLLSIAAAAAGINLAGWPIRYEDEGTYVSQARAVQYDGELAHYTYWYDHPPLAWMQIALYTTTTFAFDRYESTISAAREFMVVLHVISAGLIYGIIRRLHMGKFVAVFAVLLFALSPLSIQYGRYVFIDNVALPWLLGAFLLALSPRKHLATAMGSAACMAVAVLSKETFLIFLPALLYVLYQHSDVRNRRYAFMAFGVVLSALISFYVLFSLLKGEFIPGEGHVSLIGAALWQLFGRESTGSVFDATTVAGELARSWFMADSWLTAGALYLLPLGFLHKQLRPFALALLIGGLMMLRSGYLPIPYIIALLPFMVIVVAGVAYTFLVKPMADLRKGARYAIKRQSAELASVLAMLGLIYFVVPPWYAGIAQATQLDADRSNREAVAWIIENIPHDKRMVIESTLWSDLQRQGFDQPEPVWVYKTETDPEVTKEIDGWRGIDYLILDEESRREEIRAEFPTVFQAQDNAEVIAEFGDEGQKIVVMKVRN